MALELIAKGLVVAARQFWITGPTVCKATERFVEYRLLLLSVFSLAMKKTLHPGAWRTGGYVGGSGQSPKKNPLHANVDRITVVIKNRKVEKHISGRFVHVVYLR